MRNLTPLLVSGIFTAAVVAIAAAPARQQPPARTIVGPDSCLNCHFHDPEKEWYDKKELLEVQRLYPEKGANAGHINSLKQLDTPKSDTFAKAIGLADKYDVKGACVRCHGTVFGGDANAGVSCESCHGPASAYMTPHQVQGQYDAAVAQYGMTKLIGNVQGWTQQCTNCHVMDDDRLIKAGHPSGDDFDLAKKFLPVSPHFKKKYSAEAIEPIAKAEMEGIMRRRRPNAAPPPLVVAPPPAPEPPAPPEPAPTAGAPAAAAAKPKPKPVPAPPPVEPAGSPTSIEPPPPVAAAPVAPAPAPAAAPAAAPSTLVPAEETGMLQNPLVWGGIVVLLAIGGFLIARKKK